MGCITFSLDLHQSNIAPFIKNGLRTLRSNPDLSTLDLVNSIADSIKAANLYELGSQGEILQLSEAFNKMVKTSKLITDEQKKRILSEYENPLFKAFGLDTDTIPEIDKGTPDKDEEESLDKETDPETSEPKVLDYKIDALYGTARRVKDYMLRQFKTNIVEASLVSFKERKRIKTTRDLNKAIAKYKNALFKSLFDYLKLEAEEDGIKWDDSLVDYIYNEEGIPNVDNMQKVLDLATKSLYDLDREVLNSAFSQKHSLANNRRNQKLVDAFNAFVLLSNGNFDKVLASSYTKDFQIKKIYTGKETEVSKDKYSFKSSANYRQNWNEQNADAIKEMGGVARLFIETTPIIDHKTGLVKEGQYLDAKIFFATFTKLMDQGFVRQFDNKMKKLATEIQGNATEVIKQILEYVNSPSFVNLGLKPKDMDVLRSVYERFYNPNRPDSLYTIMNEDYKNSPVALSYDLLEVISGAIFRTNSVVFTEYKYDRDTQDMTSQEIMKSNAAGKRRKLASSLNKYTKIRADKADLLKHYNIKLENSSTGELSFELKVDQKVYKLSYNPAAKGNTKLKIWVDGRSVALANIIQEPSFIDMKDYYERNGVATPNLLSPKQQFYIALLQYIDNMTDLGFMSGRLDLLEQFKGMYEVDNINYLTEELLKLAQSAALANYVYNEYDKLSVEEKANGIGEFMKTLDVYAAVKETDAWKSRYNEKKDEIEIVYSSGLNTLDVIDNLANAERIITGEANKTVVKNADGNNIAVNRMANLANQTRYYLQNRVINNPRSAIKDNLFCRTKTNGRGDITYNALDNLYGVAIREDAISRNNVKKSASKFTESEHGYASIMLDFFGKLVNKAEYVQVQPTVYSDKTAFYGWKVGTKYTIGNITLDLESATPKQLNDAIKATTGNQYKEVYKAVFQDYSTVLEFILTPIDPHTGDVSLNDVFIANMAKMAEILKNSTNANERTRGKAVEKLLAKIQKVFPTYKSKLKEYQDKLSEVLYKNDEIERLNAEYLANGELSKIKNKLKEPVAPTFMNSFTDNEIITLLSVTPKGEYEKTSYELGLNCISNLHVTPLKMKYKQNGKEYSFSFVKPNNLLRYNATKLYADDAIYDAQMLREKKRFIKDLINFNITFPLVYSDGKVNQILKKAIKKYGGPDFKVNWVNTDTKELILAKQDGKPLNIFNPIEDIRDGKPIELNPLLEKYFLADFLFSSNLKIATSGLELAHPNKSKAGDTLNMANAELEEASRAGAQYKRNVIITATKQGYSQNSIMGVTPTMKVAVMGDVQASVYNINGLESNIDAHDGSADNNMLWHILENLSLQDAAVGEDAKPILHDFTPYGTARLFKYATFGQYNERLRKSQTSPINQYIQFRKQNSLTWNDEIPQRYNAYNPDPHWTIELGINLYGNKFTLKDVMNGDRLFFRRGNKHYEILSIDKYNPANRPLIVFGHPGIGKSYSLERGKYAGQFIDWDVEYNAGRDRWIEEHSGTVKGTPEFKAARNEYLIHPENHPDYIEYLTNEWQRVKQKAADEGKTLLASPHTLLKLFANDFDYIINLDDADFVRRNVQRGGDAENSQLWKDGINKTLSQVKGIPTITLKDGQYLENFLDTAYTRTIREVDANGNYIGTATQEMPISVADNYTLHKMLGGVQSESLKGGKVKTLSYSDASLYATVAYINNTGIYLGNGEYPTQLNTYQPLKHAMIACYINGSAMKVGAEYTNPSNMWYDADSELMVMEVATDGIGTQMDADHIVTDPEHQSTMTEFSQVISALEANGTTHEISKQAYRDLGKVAVAAMANVEQAIKDFQESNFSPEGKSKIYEIVGQMIVRELLKDGKNLGLSQSIVAKVKEEFGKRLSNQADAKFHMPFSDPSIFSKALASFTSSINKTAIKRKFPGMGAVMVPAYDKTMNFNIDGLDMSYDDVYKMAADAGFFYTDGEVNVQGYLDDLQSKREKEYEPVLNADGSVMLDAEGNPVQKLKYLLTSDQILPGDIVRVADADGNVIKTINIKTKDDYNEAKSYSHYFKVVNQPSNLKPMDVHWLVNGKQFNMYDLPQSQLAFQIRPTYKKGNPIPKELDLLIQREINNSLALLEDGYMVITTSQEMLDACARYGIKPKIPDLVSNASIEEKEKNGIKYKVVQIDQNTMVNNPAEIILSKLYAEQFGLQPGDSLYDVMSQGADFFTKRYEAYHTPKTHNYDICFTRADGRHMYIAYDDSGIKKNLAANKLDDDDQYVRDGMNLYRVDENGERLYRAGAYDEKGKLTMLVESYSTTDSDEVMEILVVKNNEQILELYDSTEFDSIIINRNAEPLQDRIVELIKKGADEGQGDFVQMKKLLTNATKDENGKIVRTSIKFRDYVARLKEFRRDKMSEQAKKKFVSFQKSLEYTVARIPAQTLQSFMKMKAVQFADSDKNVVYVTHWQTWLQGSDY